MSNLTVASPPDELAVDPSIADHFPDSIAAIHAALDSALGAEGRRRHVRLAIEVPPPHANGDRFVRLRVVFVVDPSKPRNFLYPFPCVEVSQGDGSTARPIDWQMADRRIASAVIRNAPGWRKLAG